jgi:hypothetical protein
MFYLAHTNDKYATPIVRIVDSKFDIAASYNRFEQFARLLTLEEVFDELDSKYTTKQTKAALWDWLDFTQRKQYLRRAQDQLRQSGESK